MQGGMYHGIPNLSQNPIFTALPFQILQFFLYFLIFLRAHRDIFYETQQLSDPVVDSLTDLPLDYFCQSLKDQGAINRQNSFAPTNDVQRGTPPAFQWITENLLLYYTTFLLVNKGTFSSKAAATAEAAVFRPQRPRVAFECLGSR